MGNAAVSITLSPDERRVLESITRSSTPSIRLVERARIVLMAAAGETNRVIAAETGATEHRVARWRQRFAEQGLTGIETDAPRSGRPPVTAQEHAARILKTTLEEEPPGGASHWSTRTLARQLGVSRDVVWRVWRAHALQPHRVRTFKLSTDPLFVEKVVDVVGLYLDPPENAVVFSVDEKSQCQALERTQQRRLDFDRPATISHDYRRHGTTTLFAALCTLSGMLIHRTERQHTHVEWLRFLKQIDREVAKDLDVHVICDNYCTHKHAKVKEWLARHPRFYVHFIPTSSSWLNLVERFFAEITRNVVRRGSFRSVTSLERAIHEACEHQNEVGAPFLWRATADEILAKLHMGRDHQGRPEMFTNSRTGH